MDKIKKDVNDCNREVVKELTNLYNKLSDSIDKSYYYGKKSGYEEILSWLKQSQNKSNKYITPKKFNNFLIEKETKIKILLNEEPILKSPTSYISNNNSNNNIINSKEDSKKKPNKANFNYLFYNQTFNNDNTTNNNGNYNQSNIFPTSVESAFSNKNNILIQDLNSIYNNNNGGNNNNNNFSNSNNISQNPFENSFINSLSTSTININNTSNCFINNNSNCSSNIINNNSNDSQDVQMKPACPLRTNIILGNYNLKRKKNS